MQCRGPDPAAPPPCPTPPVPPQPACASVSPGCSVRTAVAMLEATTRRQPQLPHSTSRVEETLVGLGSTPGDQCQPHSLGWAWLPTMQSPSQVSWGKVGAEAACPGRAGYGNPLPASTTPSNGIRVNQGGWGAGASPEEWQAVRQCCGGQLPPALLLITGSVGPQPLRCPSSSRRWGALWHHGVGFPGGSACCSQPGHPSPRSQSVGEVVGGQ